MPTEAANRGRGSTKKVKKTVSGPPTTVSSKKRLSIATLKSHLWNCAEILRGSAVDRTDWKAYILPLLFFKRICDVWDEETLVLDADLLEAVLGTPDPNRKAKEIEIKVARRLRKRMSDPRFKALGDRLEELKQRHEQGLLLSIDFLKALLDLARDVVAEEKAAEPVVDQNLGKAALTELFEGVKNAQTPIMVERVVTDLDEIVRYVRFDGWQNTHAGEREVKMALRKTLFKYHLHQDKDLFDRAYGYIRQYY